MANSVRITTSIPTASQVAKSLGVPKKRHQAIARLAQEAVDSYYQRGESSSRKPTKKAA